MQITRTSLSAFGEAVVRDFDPDIDKESVLDLVDRTIKRWKEEGE